MQSFEPFIHNGFVSLSRDFTNSNPVKILRDTGASQSLLLANTLPLSDVAFTSTNVFIKGVYSTDFTSIPLHNVYLSSDLVSSHVVVGILPSLRCIQTNAARVKATKSDFLSRSAERPTRRDLTVHTAVIRIRPITTISKI